MNQDDLTEAGMRQGVYDSDLFVFMLTNSVLSRAFCLKEITWALEFNKPIIIVTETEERFWPFNLGRWQRNECEKDTSVWPPSWKECWLQSTYAQCPEPVVSFIESAVAQQLLIPFRRREYEVTALAREIIRRASLHDPISWGYELPPLATGVVDFPRIVQVIASGCEAGVKMRSELIASMQSQSPLLTVFDPPAPARALPTHSVVILTDGVLEERSEEISAMMAAVPGKAISYVYLEPGTSGVAGESCWDFGKFYGGGASKTGAGVSISSHECLKYRFVDPPLMKYEHDALVTELLVRMKPVKEEVIGDVAVVDSDGGASREALSPVALAISSPPSFIMMNEAAVDEGVLCQLRAQIAHQEGANTALRAELVGDTTGASDAAGSATKALVSVEDLRARVHALAGEHFALSEQVKAKRQVKQRRTSIVAAGGGDDAALRAEIDALKAENARVKAEAARRLSESEAAIAALRAEVAALKRLTATPPVALPAPKPM